MMRQCAKPLSTCANTTIAPVIIPNSSLATLEQDFSKCLASLTLPPLPHIEATWRRRLGLDNQTPHINEIEQRFKTQKEALFALTGAINPHHILDAIKRSTKETTETIFDEGWKKGDKGPQCVIIKHASVTFLFDTAAHSEYENWAWLDRKTCHLIGLPEPIEVKSRYFCGAGTEISFHRALMGIFLLGVLNQRLIPSCSIDIQSGVTPPTSAISSPALR